MSEETQQPTQEPAATPPDRRQALKREILEFAKMIACFLVLFFVVRTCVVEAYTVQGDSMQPTLNSRERILVFKLSQRLSQFRLFGWLDPIEPGDVVVFDSGGQESKRYVKRVIAEGPKKRYSTVDAAAADGEPVSGESVPVRITEGVVYVNNARVEGVDNAASPLEADESLPEIRLAPGEMFVLGDNRAVSKDSRAFGAVDEGRLVGRAVLRFWPLTKFGLVR